MKTAKRKESKKEIVKSIKARIVKKSGPSAEPTGARCN
jgi:hypothetical protein